MIYKTSKKKRERERKRRLKNKNKWGGHLYNKAWFQEWYKKRGRKLAKEKTTELQTIVLDHYGNRCACCGEYKRKFLTIDHINNDGNIHRKKGQTFYSFIIKNNFPSNLQILCWNCNMAKAKYGKCPHKECINA